MDKYQKESWLTFIVYAGTIGAVMSILPECLSPRGRVSDSYYDFIELVEFAGDVILTITEVLMICFIMKKFKKDNFKKPTSTMLQAYVALSILSCLSSYFELSGSSNDFWEAASLIYLLMIIVVGVMFLSNRATKAIGIAMFCVVAGGIISLLIADPDNHKTWLGILAAAPFFASVYFYLDACKMFLIDKPLLVEDDNEDREPVEEQSLD